MVDGAAIGNAGFKYLGTPYSTMDCQAFVECCLYDCGLVKDLAGSNAWYREVMNHGWVGSPEECVKMFGSVPVGAFLFILEHDGKEPDKYKPDGIGNASHIGIVTGTGEGAIHSSASRGCVAESKFKNKSISGGWNRVGLYCDFVIYAEIDDEPTPSPSPDPEPEPAPTASKYAWAANGKVIHLRKQKAVSSALVDDVPSGSTVQAGEDDGGWSRVTFKGKTGWMMSKFLYDEIPDKTPDETPQDDRPTLRRGDKGAFVTLAQTKLIQKGYECGSWGADGDFGAATEKAVQDFQRDRAINADGVIGRKTWEALDEPGTALYTVTIPHLAMYHAEALVKNYGGAYMTEERG